ncbi:MAG: crossover junction endodeoxyribonuclease RuvC [Clostridiales bacterium]|nr:crossover junction endodeoxyribonuclease RuvC [Clostridiales bacterium]
MRILGIDPGYAIVGYGIIESENGKLRPLDYGAVETPAKLSTVERLKMIESQITDLVTEVKPDEIAIEELFFNTNITTGIKVAQARGVILLSCSKMCDKLFEYTPLQIKSTVTGNGTAAKTQVQFMVRQLLRLKETPKPDDAADALAAAICHALSAQGIKRGLK